MPSASPICLKEHGELDRAPIRVILADGHELVRSGIAALLSAIPSIRVVAEAGNGPALLGLLEHTPADVIVCDFFMPGMDGLETLERAHRLRPDVRTLVLSMEDSPQVVRDALARGASGYMVKHSGFGELQEAIQATKGGRYLSPVMMQSCLIALSDAPNELLTPRQVEILSLIAQGCSSRDIGLRLVLSPKTVDVHRLRIMERLRIRDVAGLTRYAIRHRLID